MGGPVENLARCLLRKCKISLQVVFSQGQIVGISRIEQPEKKHFGYYVRLNWRGIQYAKFFSDKKYGGPQNALKAAEAYFDELDQQMPLDSQVGRMTVRNTSGIVGVSRTKSSSRGHSYEYWQARWGHGTERKSAKFSIHKYGEEEAKQLAIAARQAWEKEAGFLRDVH